MESWPYGEGEEQQYLTDDYERELRMVAAEKGLDIYERDGRMIAHPSVVRVLPSSRAVRIDRKQVSTIRPSRLTDILLANQVKKPSFSASRFLESLHTVYAEITREEGVGRIPTDRQGRVVELERVYRLFTSLPGSAREYDRTDFTRDLYLLDRDGPRITSRGLQVSFPASSGTRSGRGVFSFVAPDGQVVTYYGIQFLRGGVMVNTIPLQDWLEIMDTEYLASFVPDGGASIKFAVASDELKANLYVAAQERCSNKGMLLVYLDAAKQRAHMPQDLFHGFASSVDWREAARRMVLKLAKDRVYRTEGIDPHSDGNIFSSIANANGLELQFLLDYMRPQIQERVFRESRMARDFRVAMSHLCELENSRDGEPYRGQPIIDWLTGSNTRISSVKPFSIYTSINRTTARHFFESALFWLHHVGYQGTIIILDNSRVTLARNPRDGMRYYTRAMVLEHYELLREFIDTTDRLTGALLVVVTTGDFVDEEAGSRNRGFGIYQALMTRVIDDVRDRNLVNPVASLVRLS